MNDPIRYGDAVAGGSPSLDTIREPRALRPTSESPEFNEVLQLLGKRWTASIVRRIYAGFDRFNAISRELGINPNTLRSRLQDLQDAGIVQRIEESKVPPRTRYLLTERGVALAKIVVLLQEWVYGMPYPGSLGG